jgi:hypothetical protein
MSNRKPILEEALTAWRETSKDEVLADSTRGALFNEIQALGEAAEAPFVPSLARAWRWAFLGSVPVVALTAVLILAGGHHPAADSRLAASKVDGQVVFTLANGRADHVIYRSTDPYSFDRAAAVKMARNRYTENASGGPSLVFYRID